MPQLDFDGANSKVSADKIQGQSGTTVTVPTGHKIAGTDANSITINGVNAVAVAPSTSGNVLTSTGSAWASSAAAAGGAWNLLTTQTVSNVATVEFTTNIDSTYKTYVIQGSGVTVLTSGNIYVTTGTGSTPTYSTANNYSCHLSNSSSSTSFSGLGFNSNPSNLLLADVGVGSGQCGGFTLHIHDPSNTTLQTVMTSQGVAMKNGNADIGRGDMVSVYPQTTAVTAIKFWGAAGNIGVGTFKLYGIS